jgi:LysM repeat protein
MLTTSRMAVRLLLGAGLAAATLAVQPPVAAAQSSCGDRVTVASGDTLSRIARSCGTTLSALIAANPTIDPNRLRPGMVIWTRPGGSQGGMYGRPSAPHHSGSSYVVQPGDRLSRIALELGIEIDELIALNPHVNPSFLRPGEVLRLPRRDLFVPGRAAVSVEPGRGAPGSLVRLRGTGFAAHQSLDLMAGWSRGDLRPVATVRADWRGEVEVDVRVPHWAERGETMIFALAGPGRRQPVASEPFRVTSRHAGRRGSVSVSGTLTRQGVECPVMRGDDGRTYSLLGELRGVRPGDRIHVEGRIVEMSTCMQGTSLEISRLRRTD